MLLYLNFIIIKVFLHTSVIYKLALKLCTALLAQVSTSFCNEGGSIDAARER